MTIDRYTKVVLAVIAVALVVIAMRPWLPDGTALIQAMRPDPAYAQSKYEVTIPKEWGKFVGFSNNNLLLETPDHTLRVVDVEGRAPEYPRIKVLIHWQQ
jgi:hypothetical protein